MTEKDVAAWMLKQVEDKNYLYQKDAVYEIDSKFGDEFTYENDNGNLAISRGVLKEFKKLYQETVVWERGEKAWRLRVNGDEASRQQY